RGHPDRLPLVRGDWQKAGLRLRPRPVVHVVRLLELPGEEDWLQHVQRLVQRQEHRQAVRPRGRAAVRQAPVIDVPVAGLLQGAAQLRAHPALCVADPDGQLHADGRRHVVLQCRRVQVGRAEGHVRNLGRRFVGRHPRVHHHHHL
ncbi:hypothetical protein HK405_000991, partial [Cladochytrium tenue]